MLAVLLLMTQITMSMTHMMSSADSVQVILGAFHDSLKGIFPCFTINQARRSVFGRPFVNYRTVVCLSVLSCLSACNVGVL